MSSAGCHQRMGRLTLRAGAPPTAFLPANVMLPENRMATLLSQARQLQESHCLYHATASPYTSTSSSASSVFHLLADHVCSKSSFPAANIHVLRQHTDEIWGVAFSHNGRLLATSGKDGQIVLWDVEVRQRCPRNPFQFQTRALMFSRNAAQNDFAVVGTLSGHHDGITCLAWSPDDTLLVTGSDSVVDIWDVKVGSFADVPPLVAISAETLSLVGPHPR